MTVYCHLKAGKLLRSYERCSLIKKVYSAKRKVEILLQFLIFSVKLTARPFGLVIRIKESSKLEVKTGKRYEKDWPAYIAIQLIMVACVVLFCLTDLALMS